MMVIQKCIREDNLGLLVHIEKIKDRSAIQKDRIS